MSFNSLEFLVFFILVLVVYRTVSRGLRTWVLLLSNVYFMWSFVDSINELYPILALVLLGYSFVFATRYPLGRRNVWFFVVSFSFVFVYLKRYFFVSSLTFIPFPYMEIGMSYLFFRVVHLILDRASGAISDSIRLDSYFNYVCFFPSLVSGPVQLWQDRIQHFDLRPLAEPMASQAISRMLTGYIKVFFVATLLSRWHESNATVFVKTLIDGTGSYAFGSFASWINVAMVEHPSVLGVWLAGASTVFFIYLYLNFSGYMDIVIGVAQLLGCDLPENFDRPFAAVSAIDLWNRWHITLSTWFKIYVFNPLLKALMYRWDSPKAIPYLGCIAYFVTFLLLGIWHGRTLMFVVLGLLLASGVSLNKLYQIQAVRYWGRNRYRQISSGWLYVALCKGLTFSYISISLSCMWVSSGDFASFSGVRLIGIACLAWLLLAVVAGVMIQLRAAFGEWFQEAFKSTQVWFHSFYARNGWLAVKLFFFSIVTIKSTQPQLFVYQGF